MVVEFVIVFLLTLVNGLLAMSELAIVSSRKSRLQHMKSRGDRKARAALRLIDDPGRFLSTVQIGITLVGILLGAFSGATLANRLEAWLSVFPAAMPYARTLGVGITVIALTYVSLIFGELVPKRIAFTYPEPIAVRVAGPMRNLSFLTAPAVWLLRLSTEAVLKIFGLSGVRRDSVTEEEIKSLIAEGTLTGIFEPQEREMIQGVLRLADRPVRIIMTPRTKITWVDLKSDWMTILEKTGSNHYSRLIVCDGSVDRPVGSVQTKDLLPAALLHEALNLAERMTQVLFVPENTPVLKLLDLFKKERLRIAVIVNEHGETEGIATATDVLESIAGELPERGEETEPQIIRRADGSWLVDGTVPLDELRDQIGLHVFDEDFDVDTIAGFILHHLERMPAAGDHFSYKNTRFEVVDMDGLRIDKVLIQIE